VGGWYGGIKLSKYRNKKTVVDGITFDSKREAEYYCELKLRLRAKEIVDVKLQPKFVLLEGFQKNGRKYRPLTYIADFLVSYPNGHQEVIDVKGKETEVFRIKQKLFENKYPHLNLVIVK
jgi:hypothetical protein